MADIHRCQILLLRAYNGGVCQLGHVLVGECQLGHVMGCVPFGACIGVCVPVRVCNGGVCQLGYVLVGVSVRACNGVFAI